MTITKQQILSLILNKSGANGQIIKASEYSKEQCLNVLEIYMTGLKQKNITTTYIPTDNPNNQPDPSDDSGITASFLSTVVDYVTPYFMEFVGMHVTPIIKSQSDSALMAMGGYEIPIIINDIPAGAGNNIYGEHYNKFIDTEPE